MTQVFGDFIDQNEGVGEYLKIGFHPASIPLQQRWRNNGLSADFLAGYLSTFFPGEDRTSTERQTEIKDAISYIANELLENAMKFNHSLTHQAVSIEMFLEADVITLYTFNGFDSKNLASFQAFIGRLLNEDPAELYMEKLEANAEDDTDPTESGLGFLTMLNDYGATLGWKFSDPVRVEEGVDVTTMVRLTV